MELTNKIHDAFDHIKADTQLKETTKHFLSVKRKKNISLFHHSIFPKILAAVCAILFLTAGIKGYTWIQTPVSYVSIDVNPSIELALNHFDKVLSVTAYNTEGEEILKGLSLKGKKYTEAINTIMESNVMNLYLTDDAELVFTIATTSDHENKLKKGVASCSCHTKHNTQSISTDIEVVSKAHDNGLSLGKYYAYLQLSQYDDTITIDECKDMSMSEIHHLIYEHVHGSKHDKNLDNDNLDKNCYDKEHDSNRGYGNECDKDNNHHHYNSKKHHH